MLEATVERVIGVPQPAQWAPTALDRDGYLDLMETIVRLQSDVSIREDGTAVDPATGEPYIPDRWVSGAAVLLHFGRVADLQAKVFTAMGVACRSLAAKQTGAGFDVAELTVAYHCLRTVARAEHLAEWQAIFASLDPETLYKDDLKLVHNWIVYISAAESLRETVGLGPEKDCLWGHVFFDRYMAPQLERMSEFGMYRDPGDPITYDITTRLKYATALAFGYAGKLRAALDEMLRRSGFATLLFMSPDGYVPYGGRSDQSHFQEAMVAALCELEAKRYGAEKPELAGAFRRQAHVSVRSIRRWVLDMDPPRSIKNGFLPSARHGFDGYRGHSSDVNFIAALLGLAALFADDAIPEAPCPSELGGYVFEMTPAFHKILATAGDLHVEIDTDAEFYYNATGLGRVLAKGVPLELGLGMPLPESGIRWGSPAISVADGYRQGDAPVAIGPSWCVAGEWVSLAGLSGDDGLTHNLVILEERPEYVRFRVDYAHAPSQTVIAEEYTLEGNRVTVATQIAANGPQPAGFRFTVPLLVTDGLSRAEIDGPRDGLASVAYLGHTYTVRFGGDIKAELPPDEWANRNAIYRLLSLESAGDAITVELQLS